MWTPIPLPTLCSLFPSSFHWLEVDHCPDTGGVGREGARFLCSDPPSQIEAGLSSGGGSLSLLVEAGWRHSPFNPAELGRAMGHVQGGRGDIG